MGLTQGQNTSHVLLASSPTQAARYGQTSLDEADGLVEVLALADEVGTEADLLDFLEGCGLVPGLWAEVVCQTSVGTRVVGARAHALLPPFLAANVLVRPIDPMAD